MSAPRIATAATIARRAALDLLVVNAIGLGGGTDLLCGPHRPNDAGKMVRHILGPRLGRVALRIGRDNRDPDVLGLPAERVEHLGDAERRRRADVRADGVAEEREEKPAAKVSVG